MKHYAFPGGLVQEKDIEALFKAQSRQKLLLKDPSGVSGIQERLMEVLSRIFRDEVFAHPEDQSADVKERVLHVVNQLKQLSAQSMSVVFAGCA